MRPRVAHVARVAFALLVVSALLGAGCDARARQASADLSGAELERFELGKSVSSSCWVCHDFYTEQNKVGPSLLGIFGRQAGSLPGFGFSAAMRTSGVVWDERSLDGFLANVGGFIPGNRMAAESLGSPSERAALIFYMERVTRPD